MTDLVHQLDNPAKYRKLPGVEVFIEHDENHVGPDGRPYVQRFGLRELEELAANTNRLVAAGVPIGLSEGHTVDVGPEASQPRTLAWAKNYRTTFDPQRRKYLILHDEYHPIATWEHNKTFPWRSVERHQKAKMFKPVAMLRREPRLPLKPACYRLNGDTVVRYSAHAFSQQQVTHMNDLATARPLSIGRQRIIERTHGISADEAKAAWQYAMRGDVQKYSAERGVTSADMVAHYAAQLPEAPPGQWMQHQGLNGMEEQPMPAKQPSFGSDVMEAYSHCQAIPAGPQRIAAERRLYAAIDQLERTQGIPYESIMKALTQVDDGMDEEEALEEAKEAAKRR